MRLVLSLLLALSLFLAESAMAGQSQLRVYCQACRDIVDHPGDARNFGVNQLYGADSWLTFEQANRFEVIDPFGNKVTLDINMDYIVIDINVLRDKFPYALTLILQVRVVYPNGDIVMYKFDLADLDRNGSLPLPASAERVINDAVPSRGSEDSSGDDEDYALEYDDEPFEYELDDGSCDACEVYFDGDEDGVLDADPVEWIEEL